jgi:hypothetical protein
VAIKFREFLADYNTDPQDVDLYHWDVDEDSATMVDFSLKDFTEEGLAVFKDVLDADFVRVTPIAEHHIAVYLTGVRPSYIRELCLSHAGYCSVENYSRWFTMDHDEKED